MGYELNNYTLLPNNTTEEQEIKQYKGTKFSVSGSDGRWARNFVVFAETKEAARKEIEDLGITVKSVRNVTTAKKYN